MLCVVALVNYIHINHPPFSPRVSYSVRRQAGREQPRRGGVVLRRGGPVGPQLRRARRRVRRPLLLARAERLAADDGGDDRGGGQRRARLFHGLLARVHRAVPERGACAVVAAARLFVFEWPSRVVPLRHVAG